MAEMDASMKLYVEEAKELLDELEHSLLALEEDPTDAERVATCFRAMHTIKGGGAMFGFEEVSRVTHDVESVFDRVRAGEVPVSKALLTLALEVRDHLLTLIQTSPDAVDAGLRKLSDSFIDRFKAFLPAGGPEASPGRPDQPPPAAEQGEVRSRVIYWVRFEPHPDMLLSGNEPLRLLAELDTLGILRARPGGRLPPPMDSPDFDPEKLYGYYDILLETNSPEDYIRDVFIFVDSDSGVHVRQVCDCQMRVSDLDEMLLTLEGKEDVLDAEAALRNAFVEKLAAIDLAKRQSVGQAEARPARTPEAAVSSSSTLRVDSGKLDRLLNMVGELVILQSRLRQCVNASDLDAVTAVDEDLERLTDELRTETLGMRMLPISTVFNVFQRLVRDLGTHLSKEVEFVTVGGRTELDKTVIDRLKDPLIHILRNSLDHGIEPPEERLRQGKPPRGTITLEAMHSGGHVLIIVSDDGRGISLDAVRAKAVERGLIAPDAELTEKEMFDLIFQPGFSTAAVVSDVSGRGVGMDVVRRNIEDLRGMVELQSHMGQGTKVLVRLPLTLAIIDGFNVMIENESYIIPLANLRGFQERFVTGPVRAVDSVEYRGELIPLVSLRKLFEIQGAQPECERVVVTEVEGECVGLSVDRVVGRQQAVIKSLGEGCRHIKWLSGTTINGDGSISLIVDIPQLVRFVREQSSGQANPFRGSL